MGCSGEICFGENSSNLLDLQCRTESNELKVTLSLLFMKIAGVWLVTQCGYHSFNSNLMVKSFSLILSNSQSI